MYPEKQKDNYDHKDCDFTRSREVFQKALSEFVRILKSNNVSAGINVRANFLEVPIDEDLCGRECCTVDEQWVDCKIIICGGEETIS